MILFHLHHLRSYLKHAENLYLFSGKININDDFDGGFEVILRYLYTSTATLHLTNVHGVLCAADYFGVNSLMELCEKYLSEVTLTIENCIDVYYIAKRFRLRFYNKLMEYVTQNFLKILDFEDNGKYVTSEMMLEIADLMDKTECSNNGLSQEMRFKYFRQWLNFNVHERRSTFSSLFLKLHLEDTSHVFFKSLSSDYIQNFNECRQHYYKIRRASMLSEIKHDDNLCDAVLVVGRIFGDKTCSWFVRPKHCIFGYKIGVNKWAFLGTIPNSLPMGHLCGDERHIAVNEINNSIYVCGNKQFESTLDTFILSVQKFDIVSKSWSMCNFNVPRRLSGTSALANDITIKKIAFVEKYFCFVAQSTTIWGTNSDVSIFLFGDSKSFENVSLCKTGSWSSDIDIKMSVVKNRYIVVLCTIIKESFSGTVKKGKLIIMDIITKKTKRRKILAQTMQNVTDFYDREEFMFVTKDGVIISKINSTFHKTLNVVNGHCSTVNDTIIPRTVLSVRETDTEEEEDDDDEEYFDFECGNGYNCLTFYNRTSECFSMYDFETKDVSKLPNLPYWIVPGSKTHAKIPSYVLKCAIDCTHCLYEMRCTV